LLPSWFEKDKYRIMEYQLVLSLDQFKDLCDVNGRAEFFILLAGGLSRSWKQVHYDKESNTFDIFNEIDDTWQEDVSEIRLCSDTSIHLAIKQSNLFYTGVQLWGV